MKKPAHLAIFLFIGLSFLFSETIKLEDIKIRRHKSAEKRELVDKIGVLSFDDDARKLTFRSEAGDNFAVQYSDITKLVFDSDARMNAGATSVAVTALSPLAGALVAHIRVHGRWLCLETAKGIIRRTCYESCREPYTIRQPPKPKACLVNA
jgi:hypothetical protein